MSKKERSEGEKEIEGEKVLRTRGKVKKERKVEQHSHPDNNRYALTNVHKGSSEP